MTDTVLVTGAASGIGLAIAEHFHANGWRVAAVDRRPFPSALHDRPGIDLNAADITDEAAVEGVVAAAAADGTLSAVIANAAVTDLDHHAVVDMPYATFAKVLRINVEGAFLTARAAARTLSERGRGNIVFVTSSLAFLDQAKAGDAPYCASKAAVEMLSRVLALELAPRGVNVNTLYPSTMIDTGFFAHWPAEERARLDPPTILNEPAMVLATLPPGSATGRSLDEAAFRSDPHYRASWGCRP